MIELYKKGDDMAIKTDCKNELDFVLEISQLFEDMIGKGIFMVDLDGVDKNALIESIKKSKDGDYTSLDAIFSLAWENDWGFQFRWWLPQIVDICCKYRGYKSQVKEERILISGTYVPSAETLVGCTSVTK